MAKFTLASINSRRQKITQALAGLDLSLPQVIYTARTKSLNYRWGSAMGLHSNLSLLRGSGTWDHQILKISQLLQKKSNSFAENCVDFAPFAAAWIFIALLIVDTYGPLSSPKRVGANSSPR